MRMNFLKSEILARIFNEHPNVLRSYQIKKAAFQAAHINTLFIRFLFTNYCLAALAIFLRKSNILIFRGIFWLKNKGFRR